MGPDLFTVIAQIVNFLILVALLKRFLYGPVVRAMDRREAEIAARLDDASRTAAEAESARERYENLAHELSEAREEMLTQARVEADAVRRELLEKTRDEVEQSRVRWQESFRGERESFVRSLRRRVCEQVCAVSRTVLAGMSDTSLEQRMAVCLERRIRGLGAEEREELSAHFRAAEGEMVVRSAFAMDPEARETVLRTVKSLADGVHLRFEVDPSLVCGIEILAGGRSLAWNLEDHLGNLEERLVEVVGIPPQTGNDETGS
jgi:F-type H+-transporting ATPase subunit b